MKLFMPLIALMFCGVVTASAADDTAARRLESAIAQTDANVIFMRHAIAPGFGDPDTFVLDDCATQRNLDAGGRAQARRIGRVIKAAKVNLTEILSSQWCRCMETAENLQLGEWSQFAGLNSFFQGLADEAKTMALLRQKLAAIDKSEIVLLVTHQVVINAATGISPPSGGIVLYNTRTGAVTTLAID